MGDKSGKKSTGNRCMKRLTKAEKLLTTQHTVVKMLLEAMASSEMSNRDAALALLETQQPKLEKFLSQV